MTPVIKSRQRIRNFFKSPFGKQAAFATVLFGGCSVYNAIPRSISPAEKARYSQTVREISDLTGRIELEAVFNKDPIYNKLAERGQNLSEAYKKIADRGSISLFQKLWYGVSANAWLDEAIRQAPENRSR